MGKGTSSNKIKKTILKRKQNVRRDCLV